MNEEIEEMMLTVPQKIVAYDGNHAVQHLYREQRQEIAEALYNAGYGNVSEYKAERELLGSQIKVLKQRLNDKYIEVDNLNRDYHNSFERLKAQEREIMQLKAENARFENNMKNVLEIEKKQVKIDVLNELKEKCKFDGHTVAVYKNDIEEIIKELKK